MQTPFKLLVTIPVALLVGVLATSGCGAPNGADVNGDEAPDAEGQGGEGGEPQMREESGGSGDAGQGGGNLGGPDAGSKPSDIVDAGGIAGMGGKPSAPFNGDCPSAPPFDQSNEALVARCTQPLVVGVGNGLRRALSYDGKAWFGDVWFPAGGDENENSHRAVAVGNGIIVIVGDGGILVSRDAGATFVKKDTGRSLHNSFVLFFAGAFWVVGGGGTHTTTDGLAWKSWAQSEMLPGGVQAGFGASGGATDGQRAVFVAGSNYRAFDGKTWSQGNIGGGAEHISYGKDRFATVTGFSSTTYVSTNGTSWMGSSSGSRFGDITWDGTQFFASSSQYDINGQTSPDGLTWKKYRMSVPIGPVTRFNGMYIGAGATTLYRSNNARMWTDPHRAAGDANWGFSNFASGPVLKP